jgi:hypothetical protein
MKALAAALVFACASSVLAASPGDLLRDLRAPNLGAPTSVSGATISIGRLRLNLGAGSAAKLTAGGEAIGLFFKGSGSFQYTAAEPTELPIVARNVKSDSHVKLSGNVISDEITEVMVMLAGEALPAVGEPGGASLADAFKEHQALFDRARMEPGKHLIAAAKLGLPGKAAYVEIVTPRDTLVYEYDSADDQDEGLISLHPINTYVADKTAQQYLVPTVLSDQPVGRDVRAYARPPFTITALDYTLTADGDNAKLEMTETIAPRLPGQQALRFDLATELIVAANKPPRRVHIVSVTDEQGRALSHSHDTNSLLVVLAEPATRPFKLKFVIDGDFLIREGGDNAWQLVNFAWFPQGRTFAGNYFTVHSLVKLKKPFVPIAQGSTLSRRDEGDYSVVENVVDKPIDFAIVEGGKYIFMEEKRGEQTIRVATYGMRNDRGAKTLIDEAYAFIEYYEYFLGPFPWKEYNIIQVNTWGYGQAPDGTMFITNEAFNPTKPAADEDFISGDQYFSQGINERFAHEIAHQYWGSVVKMPSSEEQWLTETFAEYSAALVMKKFRGDAIYNRMVNKWRAQARESAAVAPIPYANRIGGDRMLAFSARTHLLYNKGPLLLTAIHKKLGDEKFLIFLKSYQKSFQWKFGTTADVAGLLGFMTKEDWKPFFEQYYWGLAMPQ